MFSHNVNGRLDRGLAWAVGDVLVTAQDVILLDPPANPCTCPPDCSLCGGVGSEIDCSRVPCPLDGQ